jgi:hypothetical protein
MFLNRNSGPLPVRKCQLPLYYIIYFTSQLEKSLRYEYLVTFSIVQRRSSKIFKLRPLCLLYILHLCKWSLILRKVYCLLVFNEEML